MKRLALLLWLSTAPLFAQNPQPPSMPGMQMDKMDHSSPPQLSAPPPQLLQGVATRAPLKLEAFLAMADRNNPTLRQAAAIIRRSEAEARQAALSQSHRRLRGRPDSRRLLRWWRTGRLCRANHRVGRQARPSPQHLRAAKAVRYDSSPGPAHARPQRRNPDVLQRPQRSAHGGGTWPACGLSRRSRPNRAPVGQRGPGGCTRCAAGRSRGGTGRGSTTPSLSGCLFKNSRVSPR